MVVKEIEYKNISEILKSYYKEFTIKNNICYCLHASALNKICKVSIKVHCPKNDQLVLIKIGLFPKSNKQIFNEVHVVNQAYSFNSDWEIVLPKFYDKGWLTKNNAYSIQKLYKNKKKNIRKLKKEMFFDGKLIVSPQETQIHFHQKVLEYLKNMIQSTCLSKEKFDFNCLYQWFKEKAPLSEINKKIYKLKIFNHLANSTWKTCLTHGEILYRHILILNQNDDKNSMKWIDWEYGSFQNPWPLDLIYYYIGVSAEEHGISPSNGAGLSINSLLKGNDHLAKIIWEMYAHLSEKLKEDKENNFLKAVGLTLLCWLRREIDFCYYNTKSCQELLIALLYLDSLL